MKRKGQIVLIVGILLMVLLTLLAVIVDGGRLYVQQGRIQHSAQAAADAGIGVIAEKIVTQAASHQATAFAYPCPSCTPTPDPYQPHLWLTDYDRMMLVAAPQRTAVAQVAIEFASYNDLEISDPEILQVSVLYPFEYNLSDPSLRVDVQITQRTSILLVGLLNREFVDLSGRGISEILQR
jgi:hypothetical protein